MTDETMRWLDEDEPGWTKIDLPFPATSSSFVSGDQTRRRLSVRFFLRDTDSVLMMKVVCGPDAQGPPEHAHGGCMAAVLDEAMGAAAWLSGHPVVAAELNITFKRMLPLKTPCVVEAEVVSVAERKVRARSELRDPTGEIVYSTGEALLIRLNDEQLMDLAALTKRQIERRDQNGDS